MSGLTNTITRVNLNILLEKTTTFYSQIVICFYNSIVMFVQDVNVADRRNIAKENIIWCSQF